jgi:hypothetical protein
MAVTEALTRSPTAIAEPPFCVKTSSESWDTGREGPLPEEQPVASRHAAAPNARAKDVGTNMMARTSCRSEPSRAIM